MRILFMGTPAFAVPGLRLLLENGYDIPAVVTVPDKPSGRGRQSLPSAVKEFATERALRVLQPDSLRDPEFVADVRTFDPALIVVVAFRILPPELFTIPKLGSFNLHASLLPKYRGAAPIQWAIINGERETGVTTFFLKERVDTGNIILQARAPIGPNETAGELHDRLADIGAEVVLHTVRLIELGKATPRPQVETEASPAPKIFREQCAIDWTKRAAGIHNFVRGVSPAPGAFTHHCGNVLKVHRGLPHPESGGVAGGTVLRADDRLLVQAGEGTYEIVQLQRAGGTALGATEFLRGYPIAVGDRLG